MLRHTETVSKGLAISATSTLPATAALNTRAPQDAFGFYERLGFRRVEGEEFVTHRMRFGKGN